MAGQFRPFQQLKNVIKIIFIAFRNVTREDGHLYVALKTGSVLKKFGVFN